MGVANTVLAVATMVGNCVGGYLITKTRHWHYIMAFSQLSLALAWVLQNYVESYPAFVALSVAIGLPYALTSVSSQSALTWVWGDEVAPYMQIDNAAYGLGELHRPSSQSCLPRVALSGVLRCAAQGL